MRKDGVFYRRSIEDIQKNREKQRATCLDEAEWCIIWARGDLKHIKRRCRGGRRQAELEKAVAARLSRAEYLVGLVQHIDDKFGSA